MSPIYSTQGKFRNRLSILVVGVEHGLQLQNLPCDEYCKAKSSVKKGLQNLNVKGRVLMLNDLMELAFSKSVCPSSRREIEKSKKNLKRFFLNSVHFKIYHGFYNYFETVFSETVRSPLNKCRGSRL